jgi:Spy/CpxP family protein refolding chaperone
MLRHEAELGLSADQVKRLGELRLDFRRDAIQRVAELRAAETELAGLRRAEPADLAVVEAKLRDIERLRTELRLAAIRTVEAGKAELTAEQRGKLRTLFEERRPRRGHRPPASGETPSRAAVPADRHGPGVPVA